MSLKVSVQDLAGVRPQPDAKPAPVPDPDALHDVTPRSRVAGAKRPRRDEEGEDDPSATPAENETVFTRDGQAEVAANEQEGAAAADAVPGAETRPPPEPAARPSPYVVASSPPEQDSGWLTDGFWIKAGGAALIGGVALATDDGGSGSGQGGNTAPFITSNDGGASAAVTVPENGVTVTQVTASDAQSDRLTFSLSGDDAALFQIDPRTGALTFRVAPNFETPQDADANNAYRIVVTVSDGDLSDTQAITVNVGNVDEEGNEPPFISSNGGGSTATVNVAENATNVTTVVASDVDAGSSVTYSITGGADAALFSIVASSGVLRFTSAQNFENPQDVGANRDYEVIVTASDGSLTDSQTLTVRITNVDEAPAITSNEGGASAEISVAEGTTTVTTVTATDPDAGATLVYSISGGVDSALFSIDRNTGVLSFRTSPDFEAPQDQGGNNVYNLVVAVSDGRLFDTQSLVVTVTDVAEPANQAPVISSDGGGETAALSVAEGATAVTTVVATDPDAEDSVSYSLLASADSDLFAIDAATGVLTFIAAPDFEAPQDEGMDNVYAVLVAASDGTLTDTQSITVTVTDVSDPSPASLELAWDSSVLHSALPDEGAVPLSDFDPTLMA
jgi:hypothetical protein